MMSQHPSFRVVLYLALVLALSGMLFAQSTSKILVVNGKAAGPGVRQINGRLYVDLETLAQATNAVFTVEPRRVLLNIPPSDASGAAATDDSAQNSQKLSRDFSSAAVAAVAAIREWRVAVRAMILYGLAVSDSWVQTYHRQTLDALEQAAIAGSTEADKNALQLLRNEADMMTAWAHQVEADRQELNGARVVDPNALKDDPTLAKIQKCSQFLNSMILSGTFNDDTSCH
jgi:hypothetical protein